MKRKNEKVGGSKLPDNKEHFKTWVEGGRVGPLVMEVGVSHGCNHGCTHCSFQQFAKYGDYEFIDKDIFFHFLDDFKELGGIEIYFAGNGEPLLHPDICEFFEYGAKIGLNMTMSTNGAPLSYEMAQRIIPNVQWISFSFNGGNVEDYTAIHKCPEEDFHRVVQNIKNCMQIKQKNGNDTKIIMQFIAYSLNWKSIEDMVELFQDIGADQLNFRSSNFQSNYNTFDDRRTAEKLEKVKDIEKVVVRYNTDNNVQHWDKCYGINFRTNMDDKGNVYACNRQLFKGDGIVGNIKEKRFKDIWMGEEKESIFKTIELGEDIDKCRIWCQCSGDNKYIENYLKEHPDSKR